MCRYLLTGIFGIGVLLGMNVYGIESEQEQAPTSSKLFGPIHEKICEGLSASKNPLCKNKVYQGLVRKTCAKWKDKGSVKGCLDQTPISPIDTRFVPTGIGRESRGRRSIGQAFHFLCKYVPPGQTPFARAGRTVQGALR